MYIHFIAIGGAVMHNLALALHTQGHKVTGSDDEVFDPALSRLKKAGILLNRKILSQVAVRDSASFMQLLNSLSHSN